MTQITATAPLRLSHLRLADAPSAGAAMHEDWFAEAHREGATVVVSVNAHDPQGALSELLASDDPLDFIFKDFVRSLTGLELATLFDAAWGGPADLTEARGQRSLDRLPKRHEGGSPCSRS